MEILAIELFVFAVAVVATGNLIAEKLEKISKKMTIQVNVLETGLDNIQHNLRS